MKTLTVLLALFLVISCVENNNQPTAPSLNESKNLFTKVLKAYNKEKFESSEIQFSTRESNYKFSLKEGRSLISFTRYNNNQEYLATYDGGFIAYYIDSIKQDNSTYPAAMVERALYGFTYSAFIPLTLQGNDVLLNQVQDVRIRQKDYSVLRATISNLDSKDDEFILYISKETNIIDYIALDHSPTGSNKQFRRLINSRIVDGILFQDYITFVSKTEDIALDEMYKEYITAALKDVSTVTFSNINIIPQP